MRPRYLLVDIGDVLLLKNTTTSFLELLAEELGLPLELAQKINELHYTTMETKYITEADFITMVKDATGYDLPVNVYEYFVRAYERRTRPNTELLDFLEEVRQSGVKTAILSNTIGIYNGVQERAGISEGGGFSPRIYSWEVGLVKPNRDMFELAIEKLAVRPEEIIFIDDKPEHLQGAQVLGVRTVEFKDTNSTTAQLRQMLHEGGIDV